MNVRRAFLQVSSIAIAVGVTGWVACSTKPREANAPAASHAEKSNAGSGVGQKRGPKPLPPEIAKARRTNLIAPGIRGAPIANVKPKNAASKKAEASKPAVIPSTKAFVIPSTKAMVMPEVKDFATYKDIGKGTDAGPLKEPVRFMPPTKSGRLPKFFNRKDANPEPQRAPPAQQAVPHQNAAPQRAK